MPIRTTLAKMGHPQPPTPMQVDNTTTDGFANRTIKQKRSKTIDMRFYWVQDRVRQKQLMIYWQPGSTNLGNYHTKNHLPDYHHLICPTYLHPTNHLANNVISLFLRECVKSSTQSRAIHVMRQSGLISQKPPITQLVTNLGHKCQFSTVCSPLN